MAFLYGRAGHLTGKNGSCRPGQWANAGVKIEGAPGALAFKILLSLFLGKFLGIVAMGKLAGLDEGLLSLSFFNLLYNYGESL
jgi:hypothetical protein